MRQLLLILIIIPNLCFSQVDSAISRLVGLKINEASVNFDTRIKTLASSIDSIIIKPNISRSGTFYVDTLEAGFYQLSLTGVSGNNKPSCVRQVYITNTNGIYSIARNVAILSFSGLTNGNFDIVIVNNRALVKITGTNSITSWTYKKTNL